MQHNRSMLVAATSALLIAMVLPHTIAGQTAGSVKVTGSVTDQNHGPVQSVELKLRRGNRVDAITYSDERGQYEFNGVTAGNVTISAQRIGFRRRNFALMVAANATQQTFDIDLVSIPTDIEAVVIEESPGRLQEFADHRKSSKFGHFFDQNEIRVKNPRYVSELFRGIPGARLAPNPAGGSTLQLRGCQPKVWLDGVQAQYANIDEVIAPSEIAGIEIYPSWAGVPARYMDRENRACGSVLIWSRQS